MRCTGNTEEALNLPWENKDNSEKASERKGIKSTSEKCKATLINILFPLKTHNLELCK